MKSATAGLDGRRRASWALVATATLIALAVLLPAWASAVPGPTDLVLSKSDSADPVTQDSNFTYTIQVENAGANDATGVSVADTLPSSVDFVSMSTTAGDCCADGQGHLLRAGSGEHGHHGDHRDRRQGEEAGHGEQHGHPHER